MIETQSYSVTFPVNHVNLNGCLTPQPGITAVVGRNGSGKTFGSIELCRYLLYGKKALRGKASDYKNLTAKGTYRIAGNRYKIERSAKKEQITDDSGTILAVGPEAVTQKVIELMGYDLAVFDVCNASVQQEAGVFGNMPAAERKRLIDKVVGLTSNEQIEKACKDEAKLHRMKADAMSDALVMPVVPVKPEGYEESGILAGLIADARKDRSDYDKLRARLREVPPKPYKPFVKSDLTAEVYDALVEKQRARTQAMSEKERLQRVVSAPKPSFTKDELEVATARYHYRYDLSQQPAEPKDTSLLPVSKIEQMLEDWHHFNAQQTLSSDTMTCPHCHKDFIPSEHATVSKPDISESYLRAALTARSWTKPQEPAVGPNLTLSEIQKASEAIIRYEAVEAAQGELQNLVVPDDVSEELEQWKSDQAVIVRFGWEKQKYDDAVETNAEVEDKLSKFGPVPSHEDIDRLVDRMGEARVYEQASRDFAVATLEFNRKSEQITEESRLADEFKRGASEMADARTQVKAMLGPKLSRVASSLIHEMTNGELSFVVVDEDMDITINGQRLDTLSGAGKTVANIALRVAMGQILVGSTFPVFLADEMDSDADEVRREAIAQSLVGLKKHIEQIILVTHRSVDIADHIVMMNNSND